MSEKPAVCIICYEEKKSFICTPCDHYWCKECDEKYKKTITGDHCVMCRTKFRVKEKKDLPQKPYNSYTDYELMCYFGELPTRKRERKKYYRALRQHFKSKIKKRALESICI